MSFTTKQNAIDASQSSETDLKQAIKEANNFEPAYARILLKREISALERKMKKAGLEMSDTTKDSYRSSEGYLIKCGPNADNEAVKLLGKRVLFAKYSGEDITIPQADGTKAEFVLAMDEDIFGELK